MELQECAAGSLLLRLVTIEPLNRTARPEPFGIGWKGPGQRAEHPGFSYSHQFIFAKACRPGGLLLIKQARLLAQIVKCYLVCVHFSMGML
jgi:hypothetical protein